VLRQSPSAEATLGALFTLAREESVAEVRVAGERVHAATGVPGRDPERFGARVSAGGRP